MDEVYVNDIDPNSDWCIQSVVVKVIDENTIYIASVTGGFLISSQLHESGKMRFELLTDALKKKVLIYKKKKKEERDRSWQEANNWYDELSPKHKKLCDYYMEHANYPFD